MKWPLFKGKRKKTNCNKLRKTLVKNNQLQDQSTEDHQQGPYSFKWDNRRHYRNVHDKDKLTVNLSKAKSSIHPEASLVKLKGMLNTKIIIQAKNIMIAIFCIILLLKKCDSKDAYVSF